MTTPLATFSAFSLNNRPSVVEYNRNGSVNFNGTSLPATVGQSWIPSIDNTYDLGQNTTPLRWRDLWLSRNASVVGALTAGSLIVGGNAQFTNGPALFGSGGIRTYNAAVPDIGTSSARFGTGYFTNLNNSGTLTTGTTNTTNLTVTGTNPISFGGPIYPSSSGTKDIGSVALPWKDIYITGNIYKNGTLYAGGGGGSGTLGDLIPPVDNTYVVGNSSFRWKNGTFSNLLTAGALVVNGNTTVTTGFLNVANGNILCTGSITITGDIQMGSFNTLKTDTDGGGSVGLSTNRMAAVWALSGRFNIVSPTTNGTPVSSSSVGTSASRYQQAWIDGMNTSTVVPYSDSTGSVGTVSQRFGDIYGNHVHISSLDTPMTTTFTVDNASINFLSADQICVANNVTMLGMGDIYNVGGSGWKDGTVQATYADDTSAHFAVFAEETRVFPFGGGAFVFLRLMLMPISFSQGGGMPSTPGAGFFIRVDYKLLPPPVTKLSSGQWCGTAQFLRWGNYKHDGVLRNTDAYNGTFTQNLGQGMVYQQGLNGQVAIIVNPNSTIGFYDRFTITAMYFI